MYPIRASIDPIATLRNMAPVKQPAHIHRAMTTPLDGYADTPRDSVDVRYADVGAIDRAPRTDGLFISTIPATAQDASDYISAAYFPHKKCYYAIVEFWDNPIKTHARRFVALAMLLLTATLTDVVSNAVVEPMSTASAVITVQVLIIACACGLGVFAVFYATLMVAYRRGGYATPTAPTPPMRAIEDRSIDVTALPDALAPQAWHIYCYDYEHYDEFAELCRSLVTMDAAPGKETRHVQREIIDTFLRASLIRQRANKHMLHKHTAHMESLQRDMRARDEEARAAYDHAQAQTLRETVLARILADEQATRAVYGADERNESHD